MLIGFGVKFRIRKGPSKKFQKFIRGVRVVQTFKEVALLWNFAKALNFATIPQNFQFFAIFHRDYHCSIYSPAVYFPTTSGQHGRLLTSSSMAILHENIMWYHLVPVPCSTHTLRRLYSMHTVTHFVIKGILFCTYGWKVPSWRTNAAVVISSEDCKKLKVLQNCKVQRFCKIP